MALGKAERRYYALEHLRSPFLRRARECSKVTIPSLIPETEGAMIDLPSPYQSLGSIGTNNLASKLLIALFPPNTPNFKLQVADLIMEKEQPDEQFKTKLNKGLGKVERLVQADTEASGDRVVLFETSKHLVVGGNALLFLNPKGPVRCFHLSRYVVKRDPSGNVLEIVVRESVSPDVLPTQKIQRAVKSALKEAGQDEKTADLFTHVQRMHDRWEVYQECKGYRIPKTQGVYPLDACPWLPLRMIRVDGEDYGRSYIEEHLGDLMSLEGLSEAVVEASAAAAKIVFLVAPNGMTKDKDLATAPNCGFVSGNAEDISVLQLDKYADLRVAKELMDTISQRLARVFLLNSVVQRNAERVTAEEIRYMAKELEEALGGIYSLLSQELQLPYVKCKMLKLKKEKRMPDIPMDKIKINIVTGVEAIGRGNDKVKLFEFVKGLSDTFGPQALPNLINIRDFVERYATAIGIDTKGLVPTSEEMDAQGQQAQMQQMLAQLGPKALDIIKGAAENGMSPAAMMNTEGVEQFGN